MAKKSVTATGWVTTNFIPAPAGWRTAYQGDDGETAVYAMAGWLLQEWMGPSEESELEGVLGERRVVCADVTGGEVEPCNGQYFIRVYGPGEPIPAKHEEID